MLDINSLIWAVPGVIGLWAYNRKQAVKFRTAEGWVYLLGVVLFATPYYFILKVPENVFTFFIDSSNFTISQEKLYIDFIRLVLAALISLIFGLFFAYIRNRFGKASILEPFHNRCFEWEGKFIFITLKNNKIYLAKLLDYTKDLRFEFSIRVLPIYSGYRDVQGKVHWTFPYPFNKETQKQVEVEIVIPKEEIVCFSSWNTDEAFTDAPVNPQP